MVLGLSRLQAVVMLSGFASVLSRNMSIMGFKRTGLLAHSIAVAISARSLASRIWTGSRVPDRIFIAGLVHKLQLIYRVQAWEQCEARDYGIHTVLLPDSSAAKAVAALKSWEMEEEMINIVRQQRVSLSPTGQCKEVAALRIGVAVADSLAIGYEPGCSPFAMVNEADLETLFIHRPGVWDPLRESLVQDLEASVAGLCSLLVSAAS